MNGIVLGMLMTVSFAGASGPQPVVAAVGAAPAIHRTEQARATLKLPRVLVTEQSRPAWRFESPQVAQPPSASRSSRTARVVGAALGGLAGFWAGGAIGYYATQERTDDDGVSGLRGVVIGAPIGAAAGALLGYQLAK